MQLCSLMNAVCVLNKLEMDATMRIKTLIWALALAMPATVSAQSSNTSSNSSSNNGVVRERVVDTYCDDGYCTRTVDRRKYRDGSNRNWDDRRWDRRSDSDRRFTRWALRNFDRNGDGRLSRREYERARYAYYGR